MPTYKVTSTLLFDNNNNNNTRSSLDPGNVLSGFGLNPGMQNIDNQINILSNYSIIEKCLDKLPFDIEYYARGKVNKSNLYPASPFKVVYDTASTIPYGLEFSVQFLTDGEFHIAIEDNDKYIFDQECKIRRNIKYRQF